MKLSRHFIEQWLTRRSQIGEFANDYIEVRREYTDWSGASTKYDKDRNTTVETHVAAGDRHGRPDIDLQTHSHVKKEQQTGNGKPHEDRLSPIEEKPPSTNGSCDTDTP